MSDEQAFSFSDQDGDVLEADYIGNKIVFEVLRHNSGMVEMNKEELGEFISFLTSVFNRMK